MTMIALFFLSFLQAREPDLVGSVMGTGVPVVSNVSRSNGATMMRPSGVAKIKWPIGV